MSPLVNHPTRFTPDPEVTPNLHRAAGNWALNRARAVESVDWEAWRERARAVRADAVRHLPELNFSHGRDHHGLDEFPLVG